MFNLYPSIATVNVGLMIIFFYCFEFLYTNKTYIVLTRSQQKLTTNHHLKQNTT